MPGTLAGQIDRKNSTSVTTPGGSDESPAPANLLTQMHTNNNGFAKMTVHNSILDTVGNTPLVRLKRIGAGLPCQILGKVEYFNPGNSAKDRVARRMIEMAVENGDVTPGGTIIEVTSGNTGMGLALAANQMGFKALLVMSDKQSKEKVGILRALGADVVLCPAKVLPDDPTSCYSVAQRLAEEIPNAVYLNQYDNPANVQAHYESTGPEIWRQTAGHITHLVAAMGTCGTLCGAGKYLKEQNPDIQIIGVDAYGSTLKEAFETGEADIDAIYPYLTEAVGKDFMPLNLNRDILTDVVKVTDRAGALMARRLAKEESLLVGWSCGTATQAALELAIRENLGPEAVVVVILPDHGSRYLGKLYNDEWMVAQGLLTPEEVGLVLA